eukprot:c21193_g2_i2.p1 GENE.c21193_g2_i2~~c21193_g2_i2.p1  ORF type:complete len:353 (-),score=93.63 c21193_g2_i2:240-1298(-)
MDKKSNKRTRKQSSEETEPTQQTKRTRRSNSTTTNNITPTNTPTTTDISTKRKSPSSPESHKKVSTRSLRSSTSAQQVTSKPNTRSNSRQLSELSPLPTKTRANHSRGRHNSNEAISSKSESQLNTQTSDLNMSQDNSNNSRDQNRGQRLLFQGTEGDPSSPSAALQGLLRRLGANAMFLEELLPQSQQSTSRFKDLVDGVKSGDPVQMIASLTELCDLLSVGTEDSINGGSVELIVPALVEVIAGEHDPETDLLATRALSNIMEVIPQSCGVAIDCGVGPHLCAKLLSIEFVDLAEESLRVLEKISVEHADYLLECNAITAVLAYIDFFSTSVQRSALQTVANTCTFGVKV